MFKTGILQYIKNNSIIYKILRGICRTCKKIYGYAIDIDLKESSTRKITVLLGINFIILAVMSAIWFLGIIVAIIYTVILFRIIRKHYTDISNKYNKLLETTSKIADGNLDITIEEDLGVFNAFKKEIESIQKGFKKAVHDLDEAILLAKRHGLTLQTGQLLRIKGQVYYVLDLFKEAIMCYEEGLDCFLKVNDPIELGKMYNNISEAYVFVDAAEADRYNQAAFELNQQNEKKLEVGKSEMIRGMIEREAGHIHEAVTWMERSVTTLTEVGYI
jgi:tetratricopeptide (TPR) repeat protein